MAPEKAVCEKLRICCGFLRLKAAVLKGGTEKPKRVKPPCIAFNLTRRSHMGSGIQVAWISCVTAGERDVGVGG